MVFALVGSNNVVADVIKADQEFIDNAPAAWKDQWAEIINVGVGSAPDIPVGPGWTWEGGLVFTPPAEDVKE
jgi:hypothetical protein